ncbi:MAG: hypothetical protein V4597_11530 [Pseudomonadota bacterium]
MSAPPTFDQDAVAALWEKLDSLDDDGQEWFTALVYAALDRTGGDLSQAVLLASGALEEAQTMPESKVPEPVPVPEQQQPVVVNVHPQIVVNVPEPAAAPPAPAAAPRRVVRTVERDEEGNITRIVEETQDAPPADPE